MSFGQRFTITPLQMITAASAILQYININLFQIYSNYFQNLYFHYLFLNKVKFQKATKIVLLVILKNPGEGVNHNGGQIAAPTAGKMLSEILPYLGIDNGNKDSR